MTLREYRPQQPDFNAAYVCGVGSDANQGQLGALYHGLGNALDSQTVAGSFQDPP